MSKVIIALILGSFVGRFVAYAVTLLPPLLMNEEEEMEPAELFLRFFKGTRCWHCRASLPLLHSLPIVGYFLSKGSCINCNRPTEKKLLLLELLHALLLAATVALFPLELPALFVFIASSLLIASFITDFEHMILPDQFTLTLLWLSLIVSLRPIFVSSEEAIIGAAGGYLFLMAANIYYSMRRGRVGIFPGDFKLSAAIGAALGFQHLAVITLLSLASLIIISLTLHCREKKDCRTSFLLKESPYGCYSTIITIIFLYLELYRFHNQG